MSDTSGDRSVPSGDDLLRTRLTPGEPAADPNGTLPTDPPDPNETVDTEPPDPNRTLARAETEPREDTSVDPNRTFAATSPDKPARPLPSFPGYEVLGVLGRGGMGVVYKARQAGLNRLVALKVILAGPDASPTTLARFRAEAQAVARFQHPNLVQVFEVGDANGMPYFSLEFVDGGTLDKKVAGKPLPPREAAVIVETLARAMQYAHDRGIAHRDLKPANVLLTADGTPKIADFGLAKSLEGDSGQTQHGQVMGTPSYMAPEQASGRVDIGAPADVYALGGILYDLLTGRPPFSGSSVLDTLEMVRTREPVPPSELTGKLPRDLEVICLKCLQKEIGKRYASAVELADDLRRFLDGRPILARPVSRVEKAWRWARRNPVGAAAVLLGVIALVVPSILSVMLFLSEGQARKAEKDATDAKGLEEKAKEFAQGKQKEAETERDLKEKERARADAERKVAETRFTEALLAIREALRPIDDEMRGKVSLAPLRMKIVTLMLNRLDNLRKSAGDIKDPLDARTEAVAHARMGGIYLQTGKVSDARVELGKAVPILTRTADDNPTDVTALANLAGILNQLADAEWRLGHGDQAREKYTAALEARKKRLPLFDDLFKQKKVSQDNVTNAYYQVADSHGLVGGAALRLGDPEAAITSYEASDKGFAALKTAGTLDVRLKRSEIQLRLGDARTCLKEFDAAAKHYETAITERETLLKLTPESAGFGMALRTAIGQARMYHGDFLLMARKDTAAARKEYETALRLFAAEQARDPDLIELRRLTAAAHYRLGYLSHRFPGAEGAVCPAAAVVHFADCLRLREPLAKIDPTDTTAKVEWMLALARAGRLAEAEKLSGELASIAELDQQVRFQVVCGYSVLAGMSTDAAVAERCREKAFATLKELVKGWKARGQLELDPDLDALRDDPRFEKVVRK